MLDLLGKNPKSTNINMFKEAKETICSSNPFLSIDPKELKSGSQGDICIHIFIAALSTIARRRKQSKCPSMDEWINKMWCTHAVE